MNPVPEGQLPAPDQDPPVEYNEWGIPVIKKTNGVSDDTRETVETTLLLPPDRHMALDMPDEDDYEGEPTMP